MIDHAQAVRPPESRVSPKAALLALTGLAAALRFSTLDVQSLWADEAFTAAIASANLGDALHQIPRTESTPPAYYVLAWVWEKAFGDSAIALRSLPALLGTLTVPAVFALGAAVRSRRAGLVAAALTAISPFMVWYAQEARVCPPRAPQHAGAALPRARAAVRRQAVARGVGGGVDAVAGDPLLRTLHRGRRGGLAARPGAASPGRSRGRCRRRRRARAGRARTTGGLPA